MDRGLFDQPRAFTAGEDCDFHKKFSSEVYRGYRAKAEITSDFRILAVHATTGHQDQCDEAILLPESPTNSFEGTSA